jgi:hypothetical protein
MNQDRSYFERQQRIPTMGIIVEIEGEISLRRLKGKKALDQLFRLTHSFCRFEPEQAKGKAKIFVQRNCIPRIFLSP